jgi:peptidoglycan-N-acetylglucosamine deacetylase
MPLGSQAGFVTFSVDDGHASDLRTADLLQKYDLKATFYVPAQNAERAVMPHHQIRGLSRSFELGAHTRNHLRLTALSEEKAKAEVLDGKMWLEDLIGSPVTSFCYPGGKFNSRILNIVEQAGFLGARTCMLNLSDFPRNRFLCGVSTQAHCHRPWVQIRHALLEKNIAGAWNFITIYKATTDWLEHFLAALLHVNTHGGVAHLYLHSWEIDEQQDWHRLEAAFEAVSEMKSLRKVTNGEIFSLSARRPVAHGLADRIRDHVLGFPSRN